MKEGSILKEWTVVPKSDVKNHSEPISQFVLPKNFVHKIIFTCHDASGHLGMERTLGLLQERFFWPKMADMCRHTSVHVINV